MLQKEKKTSVGLIIILIITYLLLAIFVGTFIGLGLAATKATDADINGGLGSFLQYHFSGAQGFFSFNKFADNPGMNPALALVLPGLFYAFLFLFVLYMVVGIIVSVKKQRKVAVPSIIAVFFSVVVFYFTATGMNKYLAIIGQVEPLKDAGAIAIILSVILVLTAPLYIIFSYVLYFVSLVETFKNPRVEEKPAEEFTSQQGKNMEAPVADIAYTEEPVMFEPIEEPAMEFEPLPEPEKPIDEKPEIKEEPKEEKDDLKSLLREVVRDIVRDEIARNNANQPKGDFNPLSGGSITGATFGGPLVVQYFNGGINSPTPQPQPEPVKEEKAEPEPEPVAEEPVAEEPVVEEESQPEEPIEEEAPQAEPAPAPVEEPVEEPAPEEAPIEEPVVEEEPQPEPQPEEPAPEEVPVEEVPVEEPVQEAEPAPQQEEKKPIIRIPFTDRMLSADKEMQDNYNELKNEILSYGVNSRVSNSGDTFRLHRKTYIKITIAGLSLKLYFALDPAEYKDSTLPIQNAGHKGIYNEIPLVFKVKSGLSMRRCKQLIQDVFDKNGLEQGEIKDINWVEELRNAAPQEESTEEVQEASEE